MGAARQSVTDPSGGPGPQGQQQQDEPAGPGKQLFNQPQERSQPTEHQIGQEYGGDKK